MQIVLVHLFGYSIFFFKKLTFDDLKVVSKECQLPMLFVLRQIQSETQKHVKGVLSCVQGDKTSCIVDGTYSKCMTIPFISDALDWCCGDGCKFSHVYDGFLIMPSKQTKKFNRKVCAQETSTPHFSLKALLRFINFQARILYNQNKEKGKQNLTK